MIDREVDGAVGTARIRETKAIVCFTAEGRDPTTEEPRKDRNSGAVGVRIDSARLADGIGRTSDFAARLEQFGYRNGLFEAEELAVLPTGHHGSGMPARSFFSRREVAFILDLFHALDCAAAVTAPSPALAKVGGGYKIAWSEYRRSSWTPGGPLRSSPF